MNDDDNPNEILPLLVLVVVAIGVILLCNWVVK